MAAYPAMTEALDGVPPAGFAAPDPATVPSVGSKVPDVRGQDGNQAVATLQGAGFNAQIAGAVNSNQPAGRVVYTSPRAGSGVRSGATVRVYVSNGQPPGDQQPQPPQPPAVSPPPG